MVGYVIWLILGCAIAAPLLIRGNKVSRPLAAMAIIFHLLALLVAVTRELSDHSGNEGGKRDKPRPDLAEPQGGAGQPAARSEPK